MHEMQITDQSEPKLSQSRRMNNMLIERFGGSIGEHEPFTTQQLIDMMHQRDPANPVTYHAAGAYLTSLAAAGYMKRFVAPKSYSSKGLPPYMYRIVKNLSDAPIQNRIVPRKGSSNSSNLPKNKEKKPRISQESYSVMQGFSKGTYTPTGIPAATQPLPKPHELVKPEPEPEPTSEPLDADWNDKVEIPVPKVTVKREDMSLADVIGQLIDMAAALEKVKPDLSKVPTIDLLNEVMRRQS